MSKDIISTLVIQFKKGLPLLAWKSGLSSFSRFANNEYITGTGGETRLLLINYVHANECWVSDRYIGSYIFTYLLKLLDSDQKQRKTKHVLSSFLKLKLWQCQKELLESEEVEHVNPQRIFDVISNKYQLMGETSNHWEFWKDCARHIRLWICKRDEP